MENSPSLNLQGESMLKICRHHLVTLAAALVVFSVNAAEQRIVLNFADTVVQGENTLMLKKEIQAHKHRCYMAYLY